MTEKKRESLFDVLKALAMFMVVYWHVMSYRPGFDLATMPSYSANFIIAVNMPLFFMISGYFSKSVHESRNYWRLGNRLLCYFWPLMSFGVLFAVIESFCFRIYAPSLIPLWALKKFLFCGWFFYCLAGCDVITFLANNFARNDLMKMAICLIGFIVCLFGAGRVWHAKEIVAMIPFYWFGLWVLPIVLSRRWCLSVISIVGCCVMMFVAFFAGNIASNGLSFYWNYFDVLKPTIADALMMCARYVVGILGSILVIVLTKVLLGCLPKINRIDILGTETLGVYFLQGWLIANISNRLLGINASIGWLVIATILVYLAAFAVVRVSKLNDMVRTIVWGFHR